MTRDQDAGACAVKGRKKREWRANLLRAVSHDIRTPLTSIEGAAAGIIDNKDVLTEEQKARAAFEHQRRGTVDGTDGGEPVIHYPDE